MQTLQVRPIAADSSAAANGRFGIYQGRYLVDAFWLESDARRALRDRRWSRDDRRAQSPRHTFALA